MKPADVQYYSTHLKELLHSQEHKAREFLKHDCIKYDKEIKGYRCLPIEGYNATTYTIVKDMDGNFVCNCQGCTKRVKEDQMPNCSHIGALYLHFELINKKNNWGPYKPGANK